MIEINYNDCNMLPDIDSVNEAMYRIHSNSLEAYNIDKIYYTHRKEFLWEIVVKLNHSFGSFYEYKDNIFNLKDKKFNIIPFVFFYDNHENDHHSNFQILIIEKLLNNKYNISMITVDNIFTINKTLYINKENKSIIKIIDLPEDFEICDAGLDLSSEKSICNFIKIDKIISHIFEVEIGVIDDKDLFLDIQNNQDINSFLKKISVNWNTLEELLLYFYCYTGLDFFEKNIEILSDVDDDDLCYLCRDYFNNLVFKNKFRIFVLKNFEKNMEYTTELIKENPIVKKEKTNIWM